MTLERVALTSSKTSQAGKEGSRFFVEAQWEKKVQVVCVFCLLCFLG